jgi:hypothetical protein
MNLQDRARAGARQRARLMAAGVAAGTAGLALMLGPAALAAPAPVTPVACSAGDLAAAVSDAQSGAVLALAPRCRYVLDASLEAAVSLTIEGNGDTITTATAGLTLLLVDQVAVTLDDVTLTNGAPAIQNEGTLTVNGSAFTGNTGTSIFGDGDPAIQNEGTLTVNGSTFTGNTGAIDNTGTLTVTGSAFTGNTGTSIFSNSAGSQPSITVTGSTFSRNSVNGFSHGTINVSDGLGTLKGDVFTDNTTDRNGGAIYNTCGDDGEQCGLTITGSTFTGNTAGAAGAIENLGTLTVADSALIGNAATAPDSGYGGGLDNGGTATLTNTVIADNTASVDGGGIYDQPGGAVALTRTLVLSNTPDNCAPPPPTGTITGCTN